MPITPPETICSNKSHLNITLTQIRANDADSLGSFRYKQATPRLSVVTTITKLTSKRYNVYRKQVGKPIRKSTCRSHEDAIKKQDVKFHTHFARSDGCKAQFKCAQHFLWITKQHAETGTRVKWSFSCSCHGKDRVDSENGRAKHACRCREEFEAGKDETKSIRTSIERKCISFYSLN